MVEETAATRTCAALFPFASFLAPYVRPHVRIAHGALSKYELEMSGKASAGFVEDPRPYCQVGVGKVAGLMPFTVGAFGDFEVAVFSRGTALRKLICGAPNKQQSLRDPFESPFFAARRMFIFLFLSWKTIRYTRFCPFPPKHPSKCYLVEKGVKIEEGRSLVIRTVPAEVACQEYLLIHASAG